MSQITEPIRELHVWEATAALRGMAAALTDNADFIDRNWFPCYPQGAVEELAYVHRRLGELILQLRVHQEQRHGQEEEPGLVQGGG